MRSEPQSALHRVQRKGHHESGGLDQEPFERRQGNGDVQLDDRSGTRLGANVDFSAEPFHRFAHDVQADSPTRKFRDSGGRCDATLQNQADELLGT